MKATVILFRMTGKYYTEEEWEIPEGAVGPFDMEKSPNFRRIDGGHVLIPTQEPWGYPHILPSPASEVVKRMAEDIAYLHGELAEHGKALAQRTRVGPGLVYGSGQ